MLTVLRQRNFALLWSASLISMVGDWVLVAALPFYVYQQTGSTLATGATFAAEVLPMLLVGSAAGVFVDRWDRKRTMVVADLLRGGLLLCLLAVRSNEWLWLVYVVAVLQSSISQFAGPAFGAVVPRLVGKDHLVPANSSFSVANNLARLIGPSIGGLLMGLVGLPAVVLVDSASFFISGLLVSLVFVPSVPEASGQAQPASTATKTLSLVWREWVDGLRLVAGERWLAVVFVMMGVALLGDSMLTVLFPPFVGDVLRGNAATFGWLLTARGLGGLLGGLVVGQLGRMLSPTRLIGLSAAADGLLLLAVVASSALPAGLALAAVLALLVAVGTPVVGFYVSTYTLLQEGVPNGYRGRVFGAYSTTNALTLLVGMGVASGLGGAVGILPLLSVAGGLYLLAGAIALALLRGEYSPVASAEYA